MRVERSDTLNPPAHLVLLHKQSTILGAFALPSSTLIHLSQAKAVVLMYLVQEDM